MKEYVFHRLGEEFSVYQYVRLFRGGYLHIMMQLENRKKQISLPSSMQLQSHSHPNPPACTPEHSPTPHYYPSLTHGRGSVLRSSLDTPLSYYAANRARIRMGMMSASTVDPGSPMRGQSQSIQVNKPFKCV